MRLHLICFILVLTSALNAQLREFTIAEMPRPEVAVVQANAQFPDDALVLVYAAIEGLEFRSSLGAIDKQSYNASASRYELLLKPVKQMLFAAKAGFIEAKITTLNPNPKDVYYFRVEEKKEAQPVQSEPGTLQISSEPAGADIYLNGIRIADKTPATLKLSGIQQISIIKETFLKFDTTLKIVNSDLINVNVHLININDDVNVGDFKVVKIGQQHWMANNLDVIYFSNGEAIKEAKTQQDWINAGNDMVPMWCYYNYDSLNRSNYGKLYNWYAVSDSRGLCPQGFHVSSDADWNQLVDFLDGNEEAGSKLKSSNNWYAGGNGSNRSKFNGLPGGEVNNFGVFFSLGKDGFWWTNSTKNKNDAWFYYLVYHTSNVNRGVKNKKNGLSVRCVRD